MNHAGFDDVKKKKYLIMVVIIKKGENMSVWIQGFDDVKVELIQGCFNKHSKVKHCFKINSRSSKQDQEKDKASNNLIGWLVFASKQIVSKRSKALVIDYQEV